MWVCGDSEWWWHHGGIHPMCIMHLCIRISYVQMCMFGLFEGIRAQHNTHIVCWLHCHFIERARRLLVIGYWHCSWLEQIADAKHFYEYYSMCCTHTHTAHSTFLHDCLIWRKSSIVICAIAFCKAIITETKRYVLEAGTKNERKLFSVARGVCHREWSDTPHSTSHSTRLAVITIIIILIILF